MVGDSIVEVKSAVVGVSIVGVKSAVVGVAMWRVDDTLDVRSSYEVVEEVGHHLHLYRNSILTLNNYQIYFFQKQTFY